MAIQQSDVFGGIIEKDALLRDKFIEPPFSILDTTSANWVRRRKQWLALGIKSEVGRGDNLTLDGEIAKDMGLYRHAKGKKLGQCMPGQMSELDDDGKDKFGRKPMNGTSIFDPALCEILYHWFCIGGKNILDPFVGGSVRGIVAAKLGYNYTGIEIRPEQVMSNFEQALKIGVNPTWITGDSLLELPELTKFFDMLVGCPPYADLEVYSDLPGDISNMPYVEFLKVYEAIIIEAVKRLKSGAYAAWVVGEVRNKKGNYYGFVPDTIKIFERAGMLYYNEAILRNAIGTATIRANRSMNNQKLVKIHQNVLIFKKP